MESKGGRGGDDALLRRSIGGSWWSRHWAWLSIAVIVLAAAGWRGRVLSVPLERDEGEYAYAGQLLLEGVAPYDQAYSVKMPGIYAAYAAFLAAFGQTCTGIHLGLLVINAVTIILVFLPARPC